MSISMNIHDVASIKLGDIQSAKRGDGSTFYWRSIDFIDSKGHRILSADCFADNGYNLLIDDAEIAALNEPVLNVV